jgi:hypothetical protein
VPYIQKSRRADVSVDHGQFVKEILAELSDPQPESLTEAVAGTEYQRPHIIEGTLRHSDRLELWVVWTRWSGVREEHRTAAILDAYEKSFGVEKAQRVVIALGVTPEEARELGVIR